MSLESSSARADRLARQILLFGDVKPVAEIAAAIDAVGVDEVRAAGRAALAAGAVALAAVGPADGLASAVAIANTGR
jgi:predicted Zn-dependent peptidase